MLWAKTGTATLFHGRFYLMNLYVVLGCSFLGAQARVLFNEPPRDGVCRNLRRDTGDEHAIGGHNLRLTDNLFCW